VNAAVNAAVDAAAGAVDAVSPVGAEGAASAVASLDWLVLGPVLAPAAGALLVLVADAVAPRLARLHAVVGVFALVVGAALALPTALGSAASPRRSLCLPAPDGACLYEAGPVAGALQVGALLAAVVVLLLAWPASASGPDGTGRSVGSHGSGDALHGGPAVLVSLVLAATAGAAGVAAAHDLGSWLVSLELATLPAIALVALRATPDAGRGALALLTTSLVSFALVVMGAALWLLSTGVAVFSGPAAAAALADPERRAVLLLGLLLLLAGVGFKLSLVPFHVWTPQAYGGGTEAVAAFLAATSKVAALAALLVVVGPIATPGAGGRAAPVLVVVGIVAAVSMTVGNLVALVQDDPVRLLAWSTVAQAGWVVLPLSVATTQAARASGGYLLAYVVATLVAFVVVHVVSRSADGATATGEPGRDHTLAAYAGLLRSRPVLGGALGLALLSLAGLPPGVLGLVAKVVALRPVVGDEQWLLALVAVANAVLGIAVYLRWFTVLLRDPEPVTTTGPSTDDADGDLLEEVLGGPVPRPALAALLLSGAVLVAASVLPQLVLGLVG
jgi:NADH-quinone oxidoreductase subunit N